MKSSLGKFRKLFPSTRWSGISKIRNASVSEGTRKKAFDELCQIYWRPLFIFAQTRGHGSADAEDLVQGFMLECIKRKLFERARKDRGRLRTFLLHAFRDWLNNEHRRQGRQKRGGHLKAIHLDALEKDSRDEIEFEVQCSPEQAYDRTWRQEVIRQSHAKLRQEFEEAGKLLLFDALAGANWWDAFSTPYSEIAQQLDMSEEAVRKAASRLRENFRHSVRDVIRKTLAEPASLEAVEQELRALIQIT